jgi:hypothetical protein
MPAPVSAHEPIAAEPVQGLADGLAEELRLLGVVVVRALDQQVILDRGGEAANTWGT